MRGRWKRLKKWAGLGRRTGECLAMRGRWVMGMQAEAIERPLLGSTGLRGNGFLAHGKAGDVSKAD